MKLPEIWNFARALPSPWGALGPSGSGEIGGSGGMETAWGTIAYAPQSISYWFGLTTTLQNCGDSPCEVPSGVAPPPYYSASLRIVDEWQNCGDSPCIVRRFYVDYAANPSMVAALPLLDAWQDSALANQVLRETMHPTAFWPRIGGFGFGTGETDYDFFERVAGPYSVPEAQTWQRIAHRVGWLDEPGTGFLWGSDTSGAKWFMQQHFRAKVLADFFAQPAIIEKFGRINWPAAAGITEAGLQYERDYVSTMLKEIAKKDADIGIMGYVTLAVMSFGIGLAVSAAVAAIAAEAAAAAAAEVAAGVTAGEAVAVGAEGMSAMLSEVATSVATKVATQEIMSLITTGDLVSPDPLKLALSAAGVMTSEIFSLQDLNAEFPDVNVADVVPLVQSGWSVYQAFEAIDADPTIPLRPAPPPPAPIAIAPIQTAMPVAPQYAPTIPVASRPALPAPVTPEAMPVATLTDQQIVPTGDEVAIPVTAGVNWIWLALTLATAATGK